MNECGGGPWDPRHIHFRWLNWQVRCIPSAAGCGQPHCIRIYRRLGLAHWVARAIDVTFAVRIEQTDSETDCSRASTGTCSMRASARLHQASRSTPQQQGGGCDNYLRIHAARPGLTSPRPKARCAICWQQRAFGRGLGATGSGRPCEVRPRPGEVARRR